VDCAQVKLLTEKTISEVTYNVSCSLTTAAVVVRVGGTSGITTIPADPAMQGRRVKGAF